MTMRERLRAHLDKAAIERVGRERSIARRKADVALRSYELAARIKRIKDENEYWRSPPQHGKWELV